MNTEIVYSIKQSGTTYQRCFVFPGKPTPKLLDRLRDVGGENPLFVPDELGIPDLNYQYDERPLHRLKLIRTTDRPPETDMHAAQFLESLYMCLLTGKARAA